MYELPAGHIAPQTSTQHLTLSWSPTPSIPYEFIHSLLNHNPLPFHLPLSFAPFPILQPCNPPLPPPSAPPSILPPCSSLLLLLLLLLLSISSFLSIPPLISQHPSLLGLLAMVWCCWQSVGAGGTQTGAQMGSKLCGAARHTCSTHTQTHTYRALLCHLVTQPACLAQWYRDTNTNTQRHSCIHTYLHTFSCKSIRTYLHIHRFVHAFVVWFLYTCNASFHQNISTDIFIPLQIYKISSWRQE